MLDSSPCLTSCPAISDTAGSLLVVLKGYEKLKPYGNFVYSCIDGSSNFVTYASVALDKSSSTLLGHVANSACERSHAPKPL